MTDDDLYAALQPRGLRERLFPGLSAGQVYERLAPEIREEISGEGPSVVQQRRGIDQVYRRLKELARQGKLRSRTASLWMNLRSKGHRSAVVDLYSLR
ncbi:MAG TPA: hypothetical protein PKY30_03785 [Myxococcota bacterium]|nr:hypothetical protein [Myxococcota bacterium]